MPAVLNEAFKSPVDKLSNQGRMDGYGASGSTDSTADIRLPDQASGSLGASGFLSGGPQNPYQTNYQIPYYAIPENSGSEWGPTYNSIPYPDPNQLYQSARQPVQPVQPVQSVQQDMSHNCDRLIGEIMACRVCRQKLHRLLNAWEEENESSHDRDTKQDGGSPIPNPFRDLSPNLITNIIMGIAIIFLLDRIVTRIAR